MSALLHHFMWEYKLECITVQIYISIYQHIITNLSCLIIVTNCHLVIRRLRERLTGEIKGPVTLFDLGNSVNKSQSSIQSCRNSRISIF